MDELGMEATANMQSAPSRSVGVGSSAGATASASEEAGMLGLQGT